MIKKRYVWLDIARLVAIICLILNHVNETLNQPPITKLTVLLQLMGRMGVPLFLIISGYLMLNRNYTTSSSIDKFTHHNMIPMVYSAILWTILLSLYTYFILDNKSIPSLIQNLTFQRRPMPQMWYIQLLPIIYVLIPIFSIAKQTFSKYLVSIFLTGTILLGTGTLVANFTRHQYVPFQWNMSGSWGLVFIMLALLVFGSYLNDISTSKKSFSFIGVCALLSFVLFIVNTKQLSSAGMMPTIWYTQAWVFIPGCFFILVIKKLDAIFERVLSHAKNSKKFITTLSGLTFGVYIVHYAILDFILSFNVFHSGLLSTLLLTLLVLCVSFIAIWLITRIPKFPKFIFLTK